MLDQRLPPPDHVFVPNIVLIIATIALLTHQTKVYANNEIAWFTSFFQWYLLLFLTYNTEIVSNPPSNQIVCMSQLPNIIRQISHPIWLRPCRGNCMPSACNIVFGLSWNDKITKAPCWPLFVPKVALSKVSLLEPLIKWSNQSCTNLK